MGLLVLLFVVHFLTDFLLQSPRVAANKSKDPKVLLEHITIITGGFLLLLVPMFGLLTALAWCFLNSLIHATIDWNIWRTYRLSVGWRDPSADDTWRYWEDRWFWTTLGFDQLLHGLTIILLTEWVLR
jgi:hypothetical protein